MITKTIERNTGTGFTEVSFEETVHNSTDILKARCVKSIYDYDNNRIEHIFKVDIYNSSNVFQSTYYATYMDYNKPAVIEAEYDESGDWVQDIETIEEADNRIDQLDALFASQIKPLLIAGMKKHLGY